MKGASMHRILDELTTAYASATGCTCEKEGENHVALLVEGVRLRVGFLESSGMLLFHTVVAPLPGKENGRGEFCMKLLAANNFFSGTSGFTLGVDESQEVVTLQLAWDAFSLNGEGFTQIVDNMLFAAVDWMVRLDAWQPSPEEGKDDALMVNFLKV